MPAVNPVILLTNAPVAEPSVVLVVRIIVGFKEVLQHTPLVVMVDPPLLVILPPLEAVVWVTEVAVVVVNVGTRSTTALVVKDCSLP